MPPGSPMRGLVCRLATWTPCTMTRDSPGRTRKTSPVRPLSRPAMTTTVSPFLIFSFRMLSFRLGSQHLRRQRDDLHEPAGPQFAGHRTKDACADRLALMGDQHRGIAIEPNSAAVGPAYL